MVENKKLKLLENKENFFSTILQIGTNRGTPVEKGVILNEDYLIEIEDKLREKFEFYTAYPDIFLDDITPVESNFKLFFYQRIMLRALMRYKEVYLTACRATSKSFITILALILQCIFIPGTKRFICAPFKVQSAKIAKEKLTEIFQIWPLLRREIVGGDITELPGNYGKDYVTLSFRNKSQLDVVGASDSTRGGRRHGGLIDESRDHDEEELNEIVLPLMNVSRRLPIGKVNPKEPNQQTAWMTSAGMKGSFAYDKLIGAFENSIITPKTSFVMGLDYRVPVLHGLLDRDYVNKLKLDPSYSEASFASEYASIWRGGAEDSWYSYDALQRYRKIKNPETHAKCRKDSKQFYLLSTDVGRLHDQTVVCVLRVNIVQEKYFVTLVNIYVLGLTDTTRPFDKQALDLKKIIAKFDPECVVIDCNGLGLGMADEMIKEQIDSDGTVYPAYGFFNNEDYQKIQPKNASKILYSMKANGGLKSQINSNAYSMLTGGKVRFLIKEQEAKSILLGTKAGQKMRVEERMKRLQPHILTTRLFEEAGNLRIKKTGTDIVLEPINKRFPDDKYYALVYGLWRVKELEEASATKRRRRGNSGQKRRLTFFTQG